MAQVFISYSTADRDYVDRLAEGLTAAGLSVWYDKSIARAEDWAEAIRQHIIGCAVFVLVMSPNAERSRWVKREFNLAEAEHKPVAPLLLAGQAFWTVSERQYEDVRGGRLPSAAFVNALVGEPKPIARARSDDAPSGEPETQVAIGQTAIHVGPAARRNASTRAMQIAGTSRGIGLRLDRVSVDKAGHRLLDDLTLDIYPDEFVAVLSPSGAGRSVLASVLLGRVPPIAGELVIRGIPGGPAEVARLLPTLTGFVSAPTDLLAPLRSRSVEQTLKRAAGQIDKLDRNSAVTDILRRMDLEAVSTQKASTLTSYQQMRLSIAVAMVGRPRLLVLDEPARGRDVGEGRDLVQWLRQISDASGCTVVMLTGSPNDLDLVDHLVVLARPGRLAYDGPPRGALASSGFSSWPQWFDELRNPSNA